VSVAGSLGIRAIRDSRDLAVVTGEEIPEFVSRAIRSITSLNVISARALLDDLSGISSYTSVMPVEEVCALATEVVTDLSIVFVVCGSLMGVRRLQSVATKFPSNVVVMAVLCDENAEPSYRELAGIRVMTIAVLDDLKHLMSRSAR
jgi:hypothetical protein